MRAGREPRHGERRVEHHPRGKGRHLEARLEEHVLVRALVRAGRRDLTLVAAPGSLAPDLLIGTGRVATVCCVHIDFGPLGSAPSFRRAAESGGLRIVDVADPMAPREVGHFIPEPAHGKPGPLTNDVDLDDRGLIYIVDRHPGFDILEFTR